MEVSTTKISMFIGMLASMLSMFLVSATSGVTPFRSTASGVTRLPIYVAFIIR